MVDNLKHPCSNAIQAENMHFQTIFHYKCPVSKSLLYGTEDSRRKACTCDELWEHGEQVSTPFDGLMSFGDASELWGLSESTLRKAVSYGKLVNGVDVCKFGKQWVVSKAAMKRAYGETKR